MRIDENLKYALVLSGGGAKGLAHVGVLNALAALGFPAPSLIVGTSMGAIVGGLYACGMGPGAIVRFVLEEFDISDYLDSFVFRINGPAGKIFQAGQILGNLATKPGIDSGQRILDLFERLTGGKTFDRTAVPFRCNAVDLTSGEEVVFSSGSVAFAMRASMSFPVFFQPLIEGEHCYTDGGLAHNMPVFIARNEGFRRVLAVDVNSFRSRALPELRTLPDILYRSLETSLRLLDQKEKVRASLTIHATGTASPLDFDRKEELVRLGERAVLENEKTVGAFFGKGLRARAVRRRVRECGVS
ncbi:MAG: patatin-like phospholipase family protein [Treponema sp.]|jgi:NTE family protein|nr:patatin-like phospholipase family protein [Treponema sp.]